MTYRRRRLLVLFIALLISGAGAAYESRTSKSSDYGDSAVQSAVSAAEPSGPAAEALGKLAVKGRAPKTGYEREKFSNGWAETLGCNVRNYILKRDMSGVVTVSDTDCTVVQGVLADPYTGKTVQFVRSPEGSDDVQIDHVVALSNAWQTGAQQITPEARRSFANDPLNLMAVDGPTNGQKGDGDAATWLPPNKDYRCRYVARQIAAKQKYNLWVTQAERDAIARVLQDCPGQLLPTVSPA